MKTCNYPGCERAVMESSGGAAYAYCEAHVELLLGQAFAPKDRVPEWRRRALESRLPSKDFTNAQ